MILYAGQHGRNHGRHSLGVPNRCPSGRSRSLSGMRNEWVSCVSPANGSTMRSSTTLPHFAGSSVSAVRELAVEEHDAAISGSLGGAAGGLAGAVPTTTAAQGTAAVGALVSQGPAAAG